MKLLAALATILAPLLPFAQAAHITFSIPPTTLLPNPSTLLPSTRASLFRLNNTLTAPLTRYNTFDFKNVSPGSYLLTVQCRDYAFPPSRLDVTRLEAGVAGAAAGGQSEAFEQVEVHQTFWGNEWGNKGERRGGGSWTEGQHSKPVVVELRPERPKQYYSEREGFSPLQFLKNPMILMAVASLVLIVGLPYLTENMDPETRAEFEELQKQGPLSGAVKSDAAKSFQNFDLASWMAGKSTDTTVSDSTSSGADSGGGGGGGRKR